MADGSTTTALPTQRVGHLRLLDSRGAHRHLEARCLAPGCRRRAPCDPAPWFADGLDGLPLDAFSERLRCVCGSRQAELTIQPGPYVPAERPDLHIFR